MSQKKSTQKGFNWNHTPTIVNKRLIDNRVIQDNLGCLTELSDYFSPIEGDSWTLQSSLNMLELIKYVGTSVYNNVPIIRVPITYVFNFVGNIRNGFIEIKNQLVSIKTHEQTVTMGLSTFIFIIAREKIKEFIVTNPTLPADILAGLIALMLLSIFVTTPIKKTSKQTPEEELISEVKELESSYNNMDIGEKTAEQSNQSTLRVNRFAEAVERQAALEQRQLIERRMQKTNKKHPETLE